MASWLYQADVALALTIFGNDYLKAHREGGAWSASSFDFGHRVWFVKGSDARPDGKARAEPEAWVSRAADLGFQGFGLHYVQSPNVALDEPGSGQWNIEAAKRSASEFWEGALALDHATGLVVTYSCSSSGPSALERCDVQSARAEIEGVLQDIVKYAPRNGLGQFNVAFEQALAYLHAERPPTRVIYTDSKWDFAHCEILTLEAKRLVAAARSAWGVFGSMGAWNDRPIRECSEQHIFLTRRLGGALVGAFLAAANSAQGATSES